MVLKNILSLTTFFVYITLSATTVLGSDASPTTESASSTLPVSGTLGLSTMVTPSELAPSAAMTESTPPPASLGQQMVLDLFDCATPHFNDIAWVRATLRNTATNAGATVVTDAFHAFSPYGISGVVVIAESHLAIHTWPEHQYAAIDIFTCGTKIDFAGIRTALVSAFQAKTESTREFKRPCLFSAKE